jgi:hypothetical protein
VKPNTRNGNTNTGNVMPAPLDQGDWAWVEPQSLTVNPEFQRLIPLQSKGEYLALSASIEVDGCLFPLFVWKGHDVVLDGHTRRELCIKYRKMVKVTEVEVADEKAAIAYILHLQRQRRNLTPVAMSYFRGSDYNAVKQRRGGNRRGELSKGQFVPLKGTAQRLSDQYGVSEKTIKRDGAFARRVDEIAGGYGDLDAKRKLLGADVKLTHGLTVRLLDMSPAVRKAAVKRLLEIGQLPRAGRSEKLSAQEPKLVAQVLVARLQKKGDGHARAVLQEMAGLLGLV